MESDDKVLKGKGATLTDADISSKRVSRRALLTSLGIGAGLAAVTVATGAQAQRYGDPDGRGVRCQRFSRADPNDPRDPQLLNPNCSDNDGPPQRYGDPDGRGVRCQIRSRADPVDPYDPRVINPNCSDND